MSLQDGPMNTCGTEFSTYIELVHVHTYSICNIGLPDIYKIRQQGYYGTERCYEVIFDHQKLRQQFRWVSTPWYLLSELCNSDVLP